MAYTTIDDPTQYFEALIWTGDGNTPRSLTGLEFQPDMVWSKRRDDAAGHNILDSVRGAGVDAELCPSSDGVEGSNNQNAYGYLSAFTSDGFTVTEGSSDNAYWNNNTATYVAWCWKAETSFTNDQSATGVGSIDSAGSINTTAGFSIIGFTGDAQTGTTIAHGLGVKPNMIILKNREPDVANWQVYHSSLDATDYLQLNSTGASTDSNTRWNDVEPTSSVFTTGSSGDVCGDSSGETFISYCFANVQGFSKFGSYVGNGNADGTFVYTGFRPAYIMSKSHTNTESWIIKDATRDSFNSADTNLAANSTSSESTWGTEYDIDILSNGFKMRDAAGQTNGSGYGFIYMAFAEAPFVNSGGVPANAR